MLRRAQDLQLRFPSQETARCSNGVVRRRPCRAPRREGAWEGGERVAVMPLEGRYLLQAACAVDEPVQHFSPSFPDLATHCMAQQVAYVEYCKTPVGQSRINFDPTAPKMTQAQAGSGMGCILCRSRPSCTVARPSVPAHRPSHKVPACC